MSSQKPPLDDLRIERRPDGARSFNTPWLMVVAVISVLLAGAATWWRACVAPGEKVIAGWPAGLKAVAAVREKP
jgi:hypothetical protein